MIFINLIFVITTFKFRILKTPHKLEPKRFQKLGLIALFAVFLACPSDDECTKIITIPQIYLAGNQYYTIERELEVPCDFTEPSEPELIDAPILENFTYQILSLNITEDTGNNTWRLQFEIELNNHGDSSVTGIPRLTVASDDLEFSGSYSENAIIPCYSISSNSSCILTYDQESTLDLGPAPSSFEITNVDYVLTN